MKQEYFCNECGKTITANGEHICKENWEKQIKEMWETNRGSSEDVFTLPEFMEVIRTTISETHDTEDGYCCACEYDIAGFNERLKKCRKETIEAVLPKEHKWQKSDSNHFEAGQELGWIEGHNNCRQEILDKAKEKLNIELK